MRSSFDGYRLQVHKAGDAIAGLIIPAVGNNKLRHETLQKFMLTNDRCGLQDLPFREGLGHGTKTSILNAKTRTRRVLKGCSACPKFADR
jgi:hypothetical protein